MSAWPPAVRRCTRCTREAAILVAHGGPQLHVDALPDAGTAVAACAEHLEWAFFLGVDVWSGRRPAA
jgi:hypothetical protein